MFDSADPDPNLANQLPADAYYELVRTLRLTLPPLGEEAGTEDLVRRDRAAIARVAALAPASAAEAELAAQFVAASEQWKDCLRLAQDAATTPEWAAKCRAQANAMMRQANAALRLLLRLQQTRRKLEADQTTAERLAWNEHCAFGFMAEALAACPRPDPLPKGKQAGAAASPLAPGEGRGEGAYSAELIAGAERYAATWPERAAKIRRTGKLPSDVRYFDPPEATLARVLIHAHTPALAALDALLP